MVRKMLSSLVKDSKARRLELAVENERLKRDAVASAGVATSAAVDALNSGAAMVWHNQHQIQAEARQLHQETQHLAKQSTHWKESYQGFHQALKALGDVENWAKAIESDMAFIHSAMETLHNEQQQDLQDELQLVDGRLQDSTRSRYQVIG